MALGVGLSKSKSKKAAEDAAAEEERKFLAAEAAREGEKSDEGASTGNVVLNMDAEAVRLLRMGLGWVFLNRGDAGWIVLAYWMDGIVLSGWYHETLFFVLCLVTGWMVQMGRMDWMRSWWDRGGMYQR